MKTARRLTSGALTAVFIAIVVYVNVTWFSQPGLTQMQLFIDNAGLIMVAIASILAAVWLWRLE